MKLKFLVAPLVLFSTFSAFARPNPAVVKCQEESGVIINVRTPLGEMGLCVFETAMIDQWTLFRELSKKPQLAVQAYRDRVAKSPTSDVTAKSYCTSVALGEYEDVTYKTKIMGLCKFSDKSRIEVETLFNGPTASGHEHFNEVIGL